jgi:D-arabinose 1-dehydrogenase-like Zn-dependent alcohol dehydrogenase
MAWQSRSLGKEDVMKKGERLVIIGCGGVGGPAAMLARKLMPEVDIAIVREEREFIVR